MLLEAPHPPLLTTEQRTNKLVNQMFSLLPAEQGSFFFSLWLYETKLLIASVKCLLGEIIKNNLQEKHTFR